MREIEREMVESSELKSIQFTAALDESIKILIETFRTISKEILYELNARSARHVRQYLEKIFLVVCTLALIFYWSLGLVLHVLCFCPIVSRWFSLKNLWTNRVFFALFWFFGCFSDDAAISFVT